MSCAIDTNVFIYAHFKQYEQHSVVRLFLQKLLDSGEVFYLSWQIYYEYLRQATHPQAYKHHLTLAEAARDFSVYLDLPQCHILQETAQHRDVVLSLSQELPSTKGNFVHDLHYAAILKEHGVKEILTCDMDFKKFDFLKVVNPLNG